MFTQILAIRKALSFAALGLLLPLGMLGAADNTWTGGTDNTTWNNAGNWSDAALPDATDDIIFNATGSYNDTNADGDVDIAIGAPFTINSITFTGDFGSASGVTQSNSGEQHNFLDGGSTGGPLTISGANASGNSIDYTAPVSPGTTAADRNHDVRFNSPIIFSAGLDPVIERSGEDGFSKRLMFNRNVTATGQTVTLTNNSSDYTDAISFSNTSTTSWSKTIITEGSVRTHGGPGTSDRTLGDASSIVETATVGSASIQADPADTGVHNNYNRFTLGTAGYTELRVYGNSSTVEIFNIHGDLTGGATGVDLDLDAENSNLLIFTSTSDINIESRLNIESGDGASRIRFDGTITKAAGGFRTWSDSNRTVDGAGTIMFDLADGTTDGLTNFGNDSLDIRSIFDISGMTVDFNATGLTDASYDLIDYTNSNGQLLGPFANVIDLPSNYAIDYDHNGESIVRLILIPEPSTGALIALASLALLRRRRR